VRKAVREALPAARMDCIGAGISGYAQDIDGMAGFFLQFLDLPGKRAGSESGWDVSDGVD